MKKFILSVLIFCGTFSVSFAAKNQIAETPASVYAKIIAASYFDKYQTIIIDKEISSSQLSGASSLKSRTYSAGNMFREESQLTSDLGIPLNLITILNSSGTYISYDSGKTFFSLKTDFSSFAISELKNIEPFSPLAVLKEETETVNGKECYIIEDNGDGYNNRFYVEKKNFHLIKSIVSDNDMIVITELSNYKKIDKYSGPFEISIIYRKKTDSSKTITSKIKISSVLFNPSINADIFIPKNVSSLPNIPGLGNVEDMLKSIF